jgi:hypothetical protein
MNRCNLICLVWTLIFFACHTPNNKTIENNIESVTMDINDYFEIEQDGKSHKVLMLNGQQIEEIFKHDTL